MNKIIIISGKQYSGKDTLASILLKKMPDFKRVGIGDAIKIEYGKKNNLSFEEIEKNKHLYRNDLIELGNWGREKDKNYWLSSLSKMDKIIVPDIRVLDEVNFFKEKNAFLVRIESNIESRKTRGIIVNENDNTETNLDNYKNWDFIVYNNSDLEHLNKEADMLLEKFQKHIEKII